MTKKFLIVVLRFHGDVLLTKPMIDNIKLNFQDSEIDLLVYRGTGSILEEEKAVSEIIEIDSSSKENIWIRLRKEYYLWKKLRAKNYDYAFFLTTQWRVVPISWALGKVLKAAVDDRKRRKRLWTKSFTYIFPEALDSHIVMRNLSALKSLGLEIYDKNLSLDPFLLNEKYNSLRKKFTLPFNKPYFLIQPTSRREKKLWQKEKFSKLIKNLADKDCLIVITSGPDTHEIDYVSEIIEKSELTDDNKVLNLAGKITLPELAALIQGCKCFIGLDSVASHIAASVNTDSVTLFGPSNLVNWKPWSDKARVIQKENLEDIKVEEVINLLDEMYIN